MGAIPLVVGRGPPLDWRRKSGQDGRGKPVGNGENMSTESNPGSGSAVASVVIPAYNEGRVIGRCLESLQAQAPGPLEIVVAVNGSTDDTADVARSYPGVRVLEVEQASKIAALNAGDQAATVFPRIFHDADLVLSPGALAPLIEALTTTEARVASPRPRFVTEGADLPVRLFYTAFQDIPYVRSGMMAGLYGLSEAGRARFGQFPDVQADDLFVQSHFRSHERLTTPGHYEVQVPRDLANLLRIRTRMAAGNAALADASVLAAAGPEAVITPSTTETMLGLARNVLRRPTHLPAAATYAAVVTAARVQARRGATGWHRDDSTR